MQLLQHYLWFSDVFSECCRCIKRRSLHCETNLIWLQSGRNVKGWTKFYRKTHFQSFMKVANKPRNELRQPVKKWALSAEFNVFIDWKSTEYSWNVFSTKFVLSDWLRFCHCSTQRRISTIAFEEADSNLWTELSGQTLDQSEAELCRKNKKTSRLTNNLGKQLAQR